MRAYLFAIATTLVALSPAVSAWPMQPPSAPAEVIVWHMQGNGNVLAWTPVADAEYYAIYSGPSPDHMTLRDYASFTYYVDQTAADGVIFYGVAAIANHDSSPVRVVGVDRGDCVSLSTTLSVDVTLANCSPV